MCCEWWSDSPAMFSLSLPCGKGKSGYAGIWGDGCVLARVMFLDRINHSAGNWSQGCAVFSCMSAAVPAGPLSFMILKTPRHTQAWWTWLTWFNNMLPNGLKMRDFLCYLWQAVQRHVCLHHNIDGQWVFINSTHKHMICFGLALFPMCNIILCTGQANFTLATSHYSVYHIKLVHNAHSLTYCCMHWLYLFLVQHISLYCWFCVILHMTNKLNRVKYVN